MALQLPGAALFYIILAIAGLAVFFAIFVPKSQAQGQNILNLPFFGNEAGGESGSFDSGYKALHVKIEPGATVKIYEFHLTNQGALGVMHYSDKSMDDRGGISQYFDIKNWKDDKCALFTTSFDNTPSPIIWKTTDPLDKNYVYYISSGTIIQNITGLDNAADKNENNIKYQIDGRYERGCETIQCGDFNTGDYTVCATACTIWPWWECKDAYFFECKEDASNKVIEQPFGSGADFCNFDTTGCPSTGCCSLLRSSPTENYRLAGGLMCGYSQSDIASAKWWVCSPKNNGMTVYTNVKGEAGAIQYKCDNGEWVSAADQGISLENPEIKYDKNIYPYTVLDFYLANHNTAPIKDVSIKVTIADSSTADCTTDCANLAVDMNKDKGWAEVGAGKLFSSQGLSCGAIAASEFCYNAKKFSVEIKYQYPAGTDKTDKFEISCNPTITDANGVWQKNVCVATQVSSAQTAGSGTSTCKDAGGQCASLATCTSGAKKGSNIGKYDCGGDNICCKLA